MVITVVVFRNAFGVASFAASQFHFGGAKEYWGRWAVLLDRVRIEGTKTEHRERDVPLVLAPPVPRMHRRTFEDKLRERTARAMTPYDLRRTYSNWMEAAGILRTRRKRYMGHSAGDVTGGYELHEVSAFLAEDGKTLRQFAGLEYAPTSPATRMQKTLLRNRSPMFDRGYLRISITFTRIRGETSNSSVRSAMNR